MTDQEGCEVVHLKVLFRYFREGSDIYYETYGSIYVIWFAL